VRQPGWIQWRRENLQVQHPHWVSTVSMAGPTVPALPAMSVSFREEDVDLSRLPEDSRDIESQAFVDAVFALYQEPYEGMEGSFSCSYTEGLFEIGWIPLGDPGTELMQVRSGSRRRGSSARSVLGAAGEGYRQPSRAAKAHRR
jgi:hypothetical protein